MTKARFLALVLLCLLPAPATRAQAPDSPPAAVDPALVERFASTVSETDRTSLLAARPEIGGLPFRTALSQYGSENLRRGEFHIAEQAFQVLVWLGNRLQIAGPRIAGTIGLASVAGQRGDLSQSQAKLVEALTAAEAAHDLGNMQAALNNLGIVQRRLGDVDAALTSYERALALATELGRKDSVSRVLNNIGLVYLNRGDAARAQDYFTRSLALKDDDGGRGTQDMANTLSNIGGLYDEQGDYEQALEYHTRVLALVERLTNGPSLTSSLSNLGHVHAALGRDDLARPYLERGLAVAETSGDRAGMATLLYNLGGLSRNAGRYDEAQGLQRRSLAIREELGDRLGLIESLTELASLAVTRDHAADGLADISRAVSLSGESRLLNQLWKAQLVEGQIMESLGRIDDAVGAYRKSIDTIETLRQLTAGGERARQLYLAERLAPYYSAAALEAAAGRGFEALSLVDRGRARALLDIVATSGHQPATSVSDTERARERDLTRTILSLSSQISTEAARPRPDAARLAVLDADLVRARLDRDAFVAALYDAQPGLRIARGDAPVASRAQLAELLTPGTAIVTFVLEPSRVWAYLIVAGPNGPVITTRELTITADALTALSSRFTTQVSARDLAFSKSARALYDALFVDAGHGAASFDRALTRVRSLIVVPDGALWRVPFQALQTPRGRFLIEERAVSYVPSVSAFAALRERQRSRPTHDPFLLAIGDPAIDASEPPAPAIRGTRHGRLPEAAREVRSLGQLYGATHSAVFIGARATEAALRAHISEASVVHVATHGVLDDRDPMYSHLLLAPDESGAGGGDYATDGRLEAWEVRDLRMSADLAVLSACETARGRLGAGEGVIGLSWSLFAAGASTVVVSQWEVDSASTTALMIAFHRRLLGGPAPGAPQVHAPEALRAAAMSLMKTAAYRHPFYWAGFIVVGAG